MSLHLLKVKYHLTRPSYKRWLSAFPSTRRSSVEKKKQFTFTHIHFHLHPPHEHNQKKQPKKQQNADNTLPFFLLASGLLFCAEWKHCKDFRVIVRWAHAFLFWSCLPTAMRSAHLHLFIFTSLHIERYSDIPSHLSHSSASWYMSHPMHTNKLLIALFEDASSVGPEPFSRMDSRLCGRLAA